MIENNIMSDQESTMVSGREVINDNDLMISGTWVNKYTGEIVNVMNSVTEGNNMIIITDKGQISMDEFSKDYIQTDDPSQFQGVNNQFQDLRHLVGGGSSQQSLSENYLDIPFNDIKSSAKQYEDKPKENQILKKFFDKIDNKDKLLSVDFDPTILPKKELQTLITYLDVSLSEIAEYISDNVFSKQYIKNIVLEKLSDIIFNKDKE